MVILFDLLFDLLSRDGVRWSIRLIFFLASGFALLTSFLANVVNPNTPPCTCRHRSQCTSSLIITICLNRVGPASILLIRRFVKIPSELAGRPLRALPQLFHTRWVFTRAGRPLSSSLRNEIRYNHPRLPKRWYQHFERARALHIATSFVKIGNMQRDTAI